MAIKKICKKFSLIFLSAILMVGFSGCRFVDKETREAMQPVTLNYWRVFDNDDAFDQMLIEYQRQHPHISINYRKLRFEEYEEELLDAFAEDRGPDIFSIHNTWMKKYQTKLLPMPDTITLPYQITQGTIKKETITKLKTDPSLSLVDLEREFVPVVADDVVMRSIPEPGSNEGPRDKVFGLPLSVDTMALYYNRDLLNRFGIVQPPLTWAQFQQAVKTIAAVDKEDKIEQAAAPFGTAENVDRYFDIVSLLMMQNNTEMINARGEVSFDKLPAGLEADELPAAQALRFYTDFANPLKEVYSWNEDQENGLIQFVEGEIPFFFGYAYHLPAIRANAPELNLGVSHMPQIGDNPPVNFANYWVEVASKKTEHSNEAWDFIQFISNPENVDSYLDVTQKPTAVVSLIDEQLDDLDIGVFAEQVNSARSWYKGYDIITAEKVFADMIKEAHASREDGTEYAILIKRAAQKVAQTLLP